MRFMMLVSCSCGLGCNAAVRYLTMPLHAPACLQIRTAHEALQTKSLAATAKVTQRVTQRSYTDPTTSTTKYNLQLRKVKQDKWDHEQDLEQKFGTETARVMLDIEQMRKPARRAHVKTKDTDVHDVLVLPEYPTGEVIASRLTSKGSKQPSRQATDENARVPPSQRSDRNLSPRLSGINEGR